MAAMGRIALAVAVLLALACQVPVRRADWSRYDGPGAEVLIVPGKSHGGAWRDGTAAYEAAAAAVLEAARLPAPERVAARR